MYPQSTFATLKKYLIIGCGWLGYPLAMRLLSKGAEVWATTTSSEKAKELESVGIKPVLVDWSRVVSGLDTLSEQGFDAWIATIPPGGRELSKSLELHTRIAQFASQLGARRGVYTSSTSVYPDVERTVTEQDAMNDSLIGQLERTYQNAFGNLAILRFGGLVGEDRNPVVHLARRDIFEKPLAPVNLTTQKDALDALELVLERSMLGIYNVVNPEHPARYEFYAEQAVKRGLSLPIADSRDTSNGKIVSSSKFQSDSGYAFELLRHQNF